MKRYFLLLAFGLGILSLGAQNFAGNIEFMQITPKDTSLNMYWVKDNLVKLDQMAKKGTGVEGSFLINLQAGNIKFISPKRKLWGNQKSEVPSVNKGTFEVTRGKNTKKIAGYTCSEHIVKNVEENTIITYWITEGNFDFFLKMLKLWNRKDKQSVYYNQIKNIPIGSMPLLSEEKSISDGKLISKLEVTKIDKKIPAASTFVIPSVYTKFE
ncbi:MAG: DUF4412 domain-containing protein [Bacteroidota bacterium]